MYKVNRYIIPVCLLVLFFTNPFQGQAQCDMYCNGIIQVGFDAEDDGCTTELELSALLRNKDEPCDLENMEIHILDESGNQVLSEDGVINYEWVGRKLQYKVVDPSEKNNCWGYLDIVDKKKPELICDIDDVVEIYCFEDIEDFIEENVMVVEDCDIEGISYDRPISLRNINRCDDLLLSDTILEEYITSIVAIDSWGNVSESCDITFRIKRIDALEDLVFPKSMSIEESDFLSCYQTIPADEKGNGYPSPTQKGDFEGTGVPEMDGIPIYPNTKFLCNLWVDYEDNLVKEGCKTKIIRNWIITENACTNQGEARRMEVPQIIYIVDDKGPLIETMDDLKLSTSYDICGQLLTLIPPQVLDTCNADISLDIQIVGGFPGFYPSVKGPVEIVLDTGANYVIFIAMDACGNVTRDSMEVNIKDQTPPSMICKTYTVTSLVDEGVSMVHASSFDNGAKDECKMDRIVVKRMDDGIPCGTEGTDADFDEYVGFCCADIGENVMVLVRAYDKAGNMSECMVEVHVQDKIPAYISCPPDITVKCGLEYSDLTIFGQVRDLYSEIEQFEIDSEFFVGSSRPLKDGYAIDNCDFVVTSSSEEDINNCGAGTILRKFYIEADGEKLDSCTQTITFINNPEFFAEMEVIWPNDTVLYGCLSPDDNALSQEHLGRPSYLGYDCQMIGVTTGDEIYNFSGNGNGSCFKIIRTWNIIDWCAAPDRRGEYPTKTNTQIIKILDTIPPEITSQHAERLIKSFDPACTTGPLYLTAGAEDNECGTDLRYFYEIYTEDGEERLLQSSVINGDSIDIVIDFPLGIYRITYIFLDRCGNQARMSEEVELINAKAPTPYAYNGLAIDLMGIDTTGDGLLNTGMAEIWASDFDAGSIHPCDLPIILSFSADTSDQVRIYDCDSIGRRKVEIWATIVAENGDLIQNYTYSSIDIQDNLNQCGSGTITFTLDIKGNLVSSANHPVINSKITLEGADMEYISDNSGGYAFPPMPEGGYYNVVPSKNDDLLNGVNTLDLVKIQRHLLGLKPFESPFQFIAGDVNNDQSLSVADILELRKVILGINKNFQSNQSWRFVNNEYFFPALDLVLESGFPENYEISDLQTDMKIDFTGIKVGDVDGDHNGSNLRSIQTRSNSQFELIAKSKLIDNDLVGVDFYVREPIDILGLQLEFIVADNLVRILPGQLNINNNLFRYDPTNNGLFISYSGAEEKVLVGDQPLFTIVTKKDKFHNGARYITINNSLLQSELYTGNEEVRNIYLTLINEEESTFSLSQNQPNPFTHFTDIYFNLPENEEVLLSVFDVTGRIIVEKNGYFYKGENTIRISSDEMQSSGLLYYRLKANNQVATKKMILIK